MNSLHRNNVTGSSEDIQLSLRFDHEENQDMIRNDNDQKMEKIRNEYELNRLKEVEKNRRELISM